MAVKKLQKDMIGQKKPEPFTGNLEADLAFAKSQKDQKLDWLKNRISQKSASPEEWLRQQQLLNEFNQRTAEQQDALDQQRYALTASNFATPQPVYPPPQTYVTTNSTDPQIVHQIKELGFELVNAPPQNLLYTFSIGFFSQHFLAEFSCSLEDLTDPQKADEIYEAALQMAVAYEHFKRANPKTPIPFQPQPIGIGQFGTVGGVPVYAQNTNIGIPGPSQWVGPTRYDGWPAVQQKIPGQPWQPSPPWGSPGLDTNYGINLTTDSNTVSASTINVDSTNIDAQLNIHTTNDPIHHGQYTPSIDG